MAIGTMLGNIGDRWKSNIDLFRQGQENIRNQRTGIKDAYTKCIESGKTPAQCRGEARADRTETINEVTPNVQTKQQACVEAGGIWTIGPSGPYCDTRQQSLRYLNKQEPLKEDPYANSPGSAGKPPGYLDQSRYDNWTPQDQTPLPWIQTGAYADALSGMLNTPAFGGQTLQELEDARVQAMNAGLDESFNTAADEVTRRLNQEAAAKGMFSSGARMQNIGEQLGDLQTRVINEKAAQEAAIRGERPQLLLQERQQRADIANIWGSMDINAQGQNLDGALQGRLMEYDRQFKNGQLGLEAFQGNTNLLGLFLDYQINRARTNADLALVRANIDNIYNSMNEQQKNSFMELIFQMMGAYGGTIGRG